MKQILTILCIALLCAQCKKTTEEQPKTDFRDELVGSYRTSSSYRSYAYYPPRDTTYYNNDTIILFVSKFDTASLIFSSDKASFKTDTLALYSNDPPLFLYHYNHDERRASFGSNQISYSISSGGQGGGGSLNYTGPKQ